MQTHKKHIIRWMLTGLLALLSFSFAHAQKGKATATIDSSNILIGDHVHLLLQYTAPANAAIQWPVLNDTLTAHLEIISKQAPDTVSTSNRNLITLSQALTITCFDSGSFTIPPIAFSYKLSGDTSTYTSLTAPLLLNVNTVKVDTTQDIKDIKAPLTSPITLRELLPWIGGGLTLILVIALIIYIIIRRKKKKPIFGVFSKPALPAHIEALNELSKLRQARLWQQGQNKEYHSRISDILRIYIEKRYHIPAPEMITPEVLGAVSKQEGLTTEIQYQLKNILELADRVKFAKFQPLPDEHDQSLKEAVAFVEATADRTNEEPEKPVVQNDFIHSQLNPPDKEDNA